MLSIAFQKTVFRVVKGRLSECDMPSFAMRKTVFWKATWFRRKNHLCLMCLWYAFRHAVYAVITVSVYRSGRCPDEFRE